ncbi:hypothetical protein ABFG93_08080 [Pseudalkalibacillus hwajinpoensis]|uniref:hypothetical protein n=1 Tax=Guptibacillus hwajinpoensis TaxID=208199 RepID=UPI00325AC427
MNENLPLKLLSNLYKMEYGGAVDLWKYYTVDIIIKDENDYASINYFDEQDTSFFLKGSKDKGNPTINWLSN